MLLAIHPSLLCELARVAERPYMSLKRKPCGPRQLRPAKRQKLLSTESISRDLNLQCCARQCTQQCWFGEEEMIAARTANLALSENELKQWLSRYFVRKAARGEDYSIAVKQRAYFVCAHAWRLFHGISKYKITAARKIARHGNTLSVSGCMGSVKSNTSRDWTLAWLDGYFADNCDKYAAPPSAFFPLCRSVCSRSNPSLPRSRSNLSRSLFLSCHRQVGGEWYMPSFVDYEEMEVLAFVEHDLNNSRLPTKLPPPPSAELIKQVIKADFPQVKWPKEGDWALCTRCSALNERKRRGFKSKTEERSSQTTVFLLLHSLLPCSHGDLHTQCVHARQNSSLRAPPART